MTRFILGVLGGLAVQWGCFSPRRPLHPFAAPPGRRKVRRGCPAHRICIARDGAVWIATQAGVGRCDGDTWTRIQDLAGIKPLTPACIRRTLPVLPVSFGTMSGCPNGCLYCGQGRAGRFIAVALNLEEYMEKVVGPVIEANPWNKVFRMILGGADLITFEPEYRLFDLFTRKLAEYDGRYGHFHTTSANVEWMADLPCRDRLVGVRYSTYHPTPV